MSLLAGQKVEAFILGMVMGHLDLDAGCESARLDCDPPALSVPLENRGQARIVRDRRAAQRIVCSLAKTLARRGICPSSGPLIQI